MSSLGQNLLDFSWEPQPQPLGEGIVLRPRGRLHGLAAASTHQAQPVGNADNGFNLIFPL